MQRLNILLSRFLWVGALIVPLLASCGEGDPGGTVYKGTIHVKGLFDGTSTTKENCIPYSGAIRDYINNRNENGGIGGYQVAMEWVEDGYDVSRGQDIYNGWKSNAEQWSKVVTVFGWGTPSGYAFAPIVAADQMVFFNGSSPNDTASPAAFTHTIQVPGEEPYEKQIIAAPYSFFAATDYSTQVRGAMEFVKEKMTAGEKIAFFYCSNNEYCEGPTRVAKIHAADKGINYGQDLRLELSDDMAMTTEKIQAYLADPANQGIQWIWLGNTITSTSKAAVALARAAPGIKLIINQWGFDESLFAKCAAYLEVGEDNPCGSGNVYGMMPAAAYGDLSSASEMSTVVQVREEGQDNFIWDYEGATDTTRYVLGYATAMVWAQAVERLSAAGVDITSESIKLELESSSNISTGGLTGPVRFTPTDHRPTAVTKIYSIQAEGKLRFETRISIELLPEDLGW